MPQFDNRPSGRRHTSPTDSGSVFKRGSGLNSGRVGNADYSERNASGRSFRSNGYPKRRRGPQRSRFIVLLMIIFLVFYLNPCGNGSLQTYESPSETQDDTSENYTWTKPGTTYVNTSFSDVDLSVSDGARDRYTQLLGDGNDQATVLVYMIGSNLESQSGMATADLREMAGASSSDKVNVIVETGGAKQWQNNLVNASRLQRWLVKDNSMKLIDDSLGSASMTQQSTLEDFLNFAMKNYPANRYMLILWDHGGGSVQGYGYDELYPGTSLSSASIAAALKNSGIKLDFIGFDACLMANALTASAAEPYADYLIASEETEPGTGWYYTNWLSSLADNSSISTLQIGKQIIDDYTLASSDSYSGAKTTLSLIDLAEYSFHVPDLMKQFSQKLSADIDGGNYKYISDARSTAKEFASSNNLDQIDLVHFAKNLNTSESLALAEGVQQSIKYNRVSGTTNAYGLSIYFPYSNTQLVNQASAVYEQADFDSSYSDAIRSFATLEASGQIATSSSFNSLFDLLNGGSPQSNSFSFDSSDIFSLLYGSGSDALYDLLGARTSVSSERAEEISSYLSNEQNHIDSASLVFTEKDGGKVLQLSEEQWNLVHDIALNVWVDDGSGYIDLGLDNTYEFDDDGCLEAEYDGTWICLNHHVVSYYMLKSEEDESGQQVIEGYVPCLINNERFNILLQFTESDPGGTVLGAQRIYENGMEGKGLYQVQAGDTIDFLCDYYSYDGNYENSYFLNDPLVIEDGLTVGTYQISNTSMRYGYQLKDVYNTSVYTQMLTYQG